MNLRNSLLALTHLLYSFGMLVSALFITWCLLSRADFLYPTFYQWLDIGATITEFGPQNKYKTGFEETTMAQHVQYFSQIVTAINHDGVGLSEIKYSYRGNSVQLLRPAEILHLQDVAHLLSGLFKMTIGIVIGLLSLTLFMFLKKYQLPRIKKQVVQLIALVVTLTVISALIGFQAVFYWLHRVIFPANNEWFFYYQDSLMTTMMQAPTLFAPISLLLVLMACLIFILLNYAVTAGYKRVVDLTRENG